MRFYAPVSINMIKLIGLAVLFTQLSACSWLFGDEGTFRDRGDDYRKATMEAPLELPADIEGDAIDDSYAIPVISDRLSLDEKFVLPSPEPLSDEINRDSVRINRLDEQKWILIDGAPGQVWPRLRGFLSLNEISVQRADAVNGLIETAWLQPSGEDLLQERYQLRIDQGVQRETTEVYVLQADLRAGKDDWPSSSSNAEREEIMTQELAQYLADSAAAVAVSMLAQQAIDSSGKVTLEEDEQQQALIKLALSFDRAWASVGRALTKSGFSVDDLNRSENTYYVNYIEQAEEDEKGWFASLFDWGSSVDDEQGVTYTVKVNEAGAKMVTITIYANATDADDSEAITKNERAKLLKLIKRNLS